MLLQRSISNLLPFLLSSFRFRPSIGFPVNDDVCSPIELELDTPLNWDLADATKQPGEITPGFGTPSEFDTDGCKANDGWCNFGEETAEEALDQSLWYTVMGPESGCLTITTDYDVGNDPVTGYFGGDTQLALWTVEDDGCCSFLRNFEGFDEVAANDDTSLDGGICRYFDSLRPCRAELTRIRVIPRVKYYVQLANSEYTKHLHEGTITATSCSPAFTFCGPSVIPDWMQCCDSQTGAAGPECCGSRGYYPLSQKCCNPDLSETQFQGFLCGGGREPDPTPCPTLSPTAQPTSSPTTAPTKAPTRLPTTAPTAPPTNSGPPLRFVDESAGRHSLGVCEGDCDNDRECEFGLICYERDSGDNGVVPGCNGDANAVPGANNAGFNYCIIPPEDTLVLMGDNGSPSSAFPLGECEGDCDDNDDCEDGLRCFKRSDERAVPGCDGKGYDGKDYCYVP